MGLFLSFFYWREKGQIFYSEGYDAAKGLSLNSPKFGELSEKDDSSAVLHPYLHRRPACREHGSINSVKGAAVPCCTGVS